MEIKTIIPIVLLFLLFFFWSDMRKKWIFLKLKSKANAGDSHALCELGMCYEFGFGIKENKGKALEVYEAAAKKGSEIAAEKYRKLKVPLKKRFKPRHKSPEIEVDGLVDNLLKKEK